MSREKIKLEWREGSESKQIEILDCVRRVDADGSAVLLSRQLTSTLLGARCPHCNSIIYSRRHKLCGVCSQSLPEDYLFSETEARRIESILRTEQSRHKKWMSKLLDRFIPI